MRRTAEAFNTPIEWTLPLIVAGDRPADMGLAIQDKVYQGLQATRRQPLLPHKQSDGQAVPHAKENAD